MRLLIFLLCPLTMIAQKNCTGFVVDKITGAGIPYATVGLIRENIGVSANEQGAFRINSSLPKVDSLRISSVGYEPQVLAVSEWVNEGTVALRQKVGLLKDVVISSNRQRQIYSLNEFRRCSWNWYMTGLNTVNQLAQLFEAPKPQMQLTELELCKDPSESLFRIRVYDVDLIYGYPAKDLVDTVIEVRSRESHVRIDLESYHIVIPGKTFFVAVEWLFIPFNEQIEKVKRNGKKIDWMYYKPVMRFVSNRNLKHGAVWILRFDGKWHNSPSDQNHNFQITTKLR